MKCATVHAATSNCHPRRAQRGQGDPGGEVATLSQFSHPSPIFRTIANVPGAWVPLTSRERALVGASAALLERRALALAGDDSVDLVCTRLHDQRKSLPRQCLANFAPFENAALPSTLATGSA